MSFKPHRVPIDNVNVITERSIDVLRGIQVEVVTVVVVKIDPCTLRNDDVRSPWERTWYDEHVCIRCVELLSWMYMYMYTYIHTYM